MPSSPAWHLGPHHRMLPTAKADPDYPVPEQLFLLCQYWIPCWPTGQLREEVVPRPSRLFAPSFTWSVNARAIAIPPQELAPSPADFLGLLTEDFSCFLPLLERFIAAHTMSAFLAPLVLSDTSSASRKSCVHLSCPFAQGASPILTVPDALFCAASVPPVQHPGCASCPTTSHFVPKRQSALRLQLLLPLLRLLLPVYFWAAARQPWHQG